MASPTSVRRGIADPAMAIRQRAELRCGELLREMEPNPGTRLAGKDSFGGHKVLPPTNIETIAELGISKKQSSDWQKIADPDTPKELKEAFRAGVSTLPQVIREEGFEERVAAIPIRLFLHCLSAVIEYR